MVCENERQWKRTGREDPARRRRGRSPLLGRPATPEDLGRAALFLCGEAGGYLTGQVLTLDGGLTTRDHYDLAQQAYRQGIEDGGDR